jgi:hypothetical protein
MVRHTISPRLPICANIAAPAPRRSAADETTSNIVMQPITFSRKRATDMYYFMVENGVPMATTDPSKASDFIIPDGSSSKDLQWVPTTSEAAAQGFIAGVPMKLQAAAGDVRQVAKRCVLAYISGTFSLNFKPPSGASPNSRSSFFTPPPFASGFSPILDSGSAHPHVHMWAMEADGTVSLVQDAATLRTMSLTAQVMVAQAVPRNAVPTTADALAALQEQLINPAKLYILSGNGTISGYVTISEDDNSLTIGSEGATFFAPGLTTGKVSHTLTTQVNGVQAKVFNEDSSISGDVK